MAIENVTATYGRGETTVRALDETKLRLAVGDLVVPDGGLDLYFSGVMVSAKLPRTPAVNHLLDRSFLPTKSEQTLPSSTN